VVEDKDFVDDADKFFPVEHDRPPDRYFEFSNGKREVVKVFVMSPKRCVGVWLTERGDWIDGCDGKQSKVEAWLAKNFQMLGDGDIFYRNMMIHDGVIYWKVDYSLLIGYIRDGGIYAGRGFVFVEPIELNLSERTEGGIILPEMSRKGKVKRTGVVRYIGPPRQGRRALSLQDGDRVVWDHRFGEQYEIGGLPWIVVKQEHILGKEWI
jgi:co-chaperonin GroES (HSP10)